jgi:hypothetical protein
MPQNKHRTTHGGARSNSGRPPKLHKDKWGQITCVLRHDTIEKLRTGADSRFFGEFLQHHLDRYPLPSREQYLMIRRERLRPSWTLSGGKYPRAPKPRVPRPQGNYRDPQMHHRVAMLMALADITEEEAIKRIRKGDRARKNLESQSVAN